MTMSQDLLNKVMSQNMRLQKEIKNMLTLDVEIEDEYGFATFSNGQVTFCLDGIPITDYIDAANACINGTNWKGSVISVQDGIVSITIESMGGCQGGSITYKIKAKFCSDAFVRAYNELSVLE
jgi:hypothetical protein